MKIIQHENLAIYGIICIHVHACILEFDTLFSF